MRFLLALLLLLSCWRATAEPGVDDKRIVIGMSSPLSGQIGAYGQAMLTTIQAYFQQINAQGGIYGRKLELIALDDGYETDKTLANTQEFVHQREAFALLAYYGSTPTTEAMNKVFGPAGVPLIGTISGAASLREPQHLQPHSRFMFNTRASYADESAAIVQHLLSFNLKHIAVVYQNDGFGLSCLEATRQALVAHGLKPGAVASIERNTVDIEQAVETIATAKPQAVILATLYKPTAAFIQAMHQRGLRPMYMTLSPVGAEQLTQALGQRARGIGISQVIPYPWSESTPVVRDYQKLVGKQASYSYYGLEGYLMARVLVEGLKRSGKEPSRQKLIQALESAPIDLGGYRIEYGKQDRRGSRFVEMTVIGAGGKTLR